MTGRIKVINDIYKGDGINNCRWCNDTGWMKTFGISGILYHDAPCICKIGQRVLNDLLRSQNGI
jgi:hypothetical protein